MKFFFPKQQIGGWLITILMIVAEYVVSLFPPRYTEFFEGDIALSYSLHNTVKYVYVILFCYCVPTLIFCIVILFSKQKNKTIWIHDVLYIAARAFATNEIIIVSMKNLIGRPRPCFYQLCDYEHTTVMDPTGVAYNVYGIVGKLGNVTKCHASTSSIYNAFRSFPSGHSATAISSLVITMLMVSRFIDSTYAWNQYKMRTMKALSILPLLIWSLFILGSRIFDYRHRPEDVIGGTVLGALSSLMVYFLFHPNNPYNYKRVASKPTSETKAASSGFFADVNETIINAYSPVEVNSSIYL